MKSLALAILPIMIFSFTHQADAQVSANRGSQAVVCYDQNKQIQSAELFDLYEARTFHGMKLQTWPAGTDFLTIAAEVAERLDHGKLGQIYIQELDNKHAVIRDLGFPEFIFTVESWKKYGYRDEMITSGASLKKTRDAKSLLVPSHCKVKQLSITVDQSEKTYVVSDIWDRLNEVNKAAYVLRSSVYHTLARSGGETDSEHARRTIGLAFSGYQFESVLAGVPEKFTFCSSAGDNPLYKLFAYENSEKKTVLQFLRFAGKDTATKSTMTVDRQAGPLADPKEFAGGASGMTFEQKGDLQIVSTFHNRSVAKKRIEFSIGERMDLFAVPEKMSLLNCVPGSFYKD